jgi:tRNA-(ms[2]io[6]A)-hydroxylase
MNTIAQIDISADIAPVLSFLACQTPKVWCEYAADHLDVLLVDHAHCEKKAASKAMQLIYRYPYHYELIQQLSKLIREEMRYFEQVLKILTL